MGFGLGNFVGVKRKALIDDSEQLIRKIIVNVPMPDQQTKVEISLDSIMEKLLKAIRESSLIKYRIDILKVEEHFATENDKKMENQFIYGFI